MSVVATSRKLCDAVDGLRDGLALAAHDGESVEGVGLGVGAGVGFGVGFEVGRGVGGGGGGTRAKTMLAWPVKDSPPLPAGAPMLGVGPPESYPISTRPLLLSSDKPHPHTCHAADPAGMTALLPRRRVTMRRSRRCFRVGRRSTR